MEIIEEEKVKLVAYRLKGAAFVWWDRLKETIKRLGKNPINSVEDAAIIER